MNKYISLSLLVLLLSCQTKKELENIPECTLQHELLFENEPVIGKVRNMALMNDSIPVIININSGKVFQLLDYKRQNIKDYGDWGQGPDELLFPVSLFASGDNTMTFWDINKRKYSAMQITDGDTVIRFNHLFENRDSLFHFEVLPVANNRFVATGIYKDYRLVLLDSNGCFSKGFGQCPFRDEEESRVSGMIRSEIYQGKIAVNPSGTKLVHALLHADILSFYEISGSGDLQLKSEQINAYPDYQYNSAAMSISSPVYYLDVCATGRYVYALYSGRNYKDHKEKAVVGKTVKVYDWNGKIVKKINLDTDVKVMCVSSDDRKIYAIAHHPDPVLVSFTLE